MVEALAPPSRPHSTASQPVVGTTQRNVGRGLSVTALAAAVNLPLALLTVPLFLHRLTLVSYGVFATLGSVLSMIALVEAGVGTEITRRVAVAHGRGDRAALRRTVREGTSILFGLAAGALVLGTASGFLLRDTIFGSLPEPLRSEVPWLTLVVTIAFSADLCLSGWFATLTGLQRPEWAGIAGLAGVLISTLVTVILILAGIGIWALAIGAVCQVAVSAGIRSLGMRRIAPDVPLRFCQVSRSDARAYAGTSAVVLIATIANIIDFQFDKILLANFVGAAAAGAYQIGASLALQARSLALLPVSVLIPSTAELGEGPALARLRRAITQLNTGASLVLMGGIVAFGPTFVKLWLGPGYGRTAFAAQLLAVALFFNAVTGPWYTHCIGIGLIRIPLMSAIANAVVNATVSWTLIAAIGFDGAVYGSLAGNIAGFTVFGLLIRGQQPGGWLVGLIRPTLLVTAATLGVLVGMRSVPAHWFWLVLCGTAWVVVLGGVFLALRWLPLRLHRRGKLSITLSLA